MTLKLKNMGAVNVNRVEFNGLDIYFSYEVPVAFCGSEGIVCRVNDWGPTTGKLMSKVQPDKSKRVPSDVFEAALKAELAAAAKR